MSRLEDLASLPTLRTERLLLRALGPEDVEAMHAAYSDPVVMRHWSSAPHADMGTTRATVERSIRGFEDRSALQWGVERIDRPGVIGSVTLLPRPTQPMAEFGYIFAREHWGQGFAYEAQSAVIDFAFGELSLRRLEADTDPENTASIRSLERLGFRREGLLRERWVVEGKVCDSAIFGLLASEWRA